MSINSSRVSSCGGLALSVGRRLGVLVVLGLLGFVSDLSGLLVGQVPGDLLIAGDTSRGTR